MTQMFDMRRGRKSHRVEQGPAQFHMMALTSVQILSRHGGGWELARWLPSPILAS